MKLSVMIFAAGLGLTTAAAAGELARVENVRTEWQNAYGVILYTALAEVKNLSDRPLQYVKIRVELFDKNGTKVAERSGYNAGAEVLADEIPGSPEDKLKRIKPIPAGGSDLVRISLDKTDIGKPFRKAEVVVVEAR